MNNTHRSIVLMSLLCLCASPVLALDSELANKENMAAQVDKQQKAQSENKKRPERRQRISSWWQIPHVIDFLILDQEQRQKMDESRARFVEQEHQYSDQMKALHKEIGAASLAQDKKSRSKLVEQLVALGTQASSNAVDFKIQVLDLMSKEQLALVSGRYPEILDKRWGKRTRSFVKDKPSKRVKQDLPPVGAQPGDSNPPSGHP